MKKDREGVGVSGRQDAILGIRHAVTLSNIDGVTTAGVVRLAWVTCRVDLASVVSSRGRGMTAVGELADAGGLTASIAAGSR